ncbi:MAG: hypothetical protein R2825_12795 [Saprospiraceae bacterium]
MGQLPISSKNVELTARTAEKNTKSIIAEKSRDADLTILGFQTGLVKHEGQTVLRYDGIGNVLFVMRQWGKK